MAVVFEAASARSSWSTAAAGSTHRGAGHWPDPAQGAPSYAGRQGESRQGRAAHVPAARRQRAAQVLPQEAFQRVLRYDLALVSPYFEFEVAERAVKAAF
eukprot:8821577-Lingulodinium_polyedra.AAC.1